jgi:iron-sulfur cluster assembly protein
MNITISPEAIVNIKRLQKEYGAVGNALRFGLSTSGCSGYKYILEFEEHPSDSDVVLESEGIIIHVNESHRNKLKDSVIGWKETSFLEGFHIDNPQAKQPCGCGESINFIEE